MNIIDQAKGRNKTNEYEQTEKRNAEILHTVIISLSSHNHMIHIITKAHI